MFFKKKSVKRLKVTEPRQPAAAPAAPVSRYQHQRAVEEEQAPLMGQRAAAPTRIVGGAPYTPISDTTGQGNHQRRQKRDHTQGDFCGGYPYNIIVAVFIVIILAVAGYFVYEDWSSSGSSSVPSPTISPTVYGDTHAPTLADHDKTRAPTRPPTHAPTRGPPPGKPTPEPTRGPPPGKPTPEPTRGPPPGKPTPEPTRAPKSDDGKGGDDDYSGGGGGGGGGGKSAEADDDEHVARGGVNPPTPWMSGDGSSDSDSSSDIGNVAVETTPAGPVTSPAAAPAIGSRLRHQRR